MTITGICMSVYECNQCVNVYTTVTYVFISNTVIYKPFLKKKNGVRITDM